MDVLVQLQTWWQNTTPQTQGVLRDVGVALAALLIGYYLGGMVAGALRARNFDGALRLPGAGEPGHGFTPTLFAGLLVRMTVWAGAAWWLAARHGRAELAATLGRVISRAWALAAILVVALALGSLMARRLVECLHGLPGTGGEGAPYRNGSAASHRGGAAGAVGAGAYVLSVLLALLIAADLFDWPLTRASAQGLWQFAQRLLVAGAALLIGCLGARWARDLATPDGSASPERRAGHFIGVGVVAATTVLAVAVLLSGFGLLIGLGALAVLGVPLWFGRGYLPDLVAGLELRAHKVREVWVGESSWQVSEVGLLTTQLCRAGEFSQMQNRVVLDALLDAAPTAAGRR